MAATGCATDVFAVVGWMIKPLPHLEKHVTARKQPYERHPPRSPDTCCNCAPDRPCTRRPAYRCWHRALQRTLHGLQLMDDHNQRGADLLRQVVLLEAPPGLREVVPAQTVCCSAERPCRGAQPYRHRHCAALRSRGPLVPAHLTSLSGHAAEATRAHGYGGHVCHARVPPQRKATIVGRGRRDSHAACAGLGFRSGLG